MIVKSGNMSLGVNLLAVLVRAGGEGARRRISTSRSSKCTTATRSTRPPARRCCSARRRPSGRGVALAEALGARARRPYRPAAAKARIGFATLRGGSVVGDHQVHALPATGETIDALPSRRATASIFARGAVKAALWARGRKPGRYSMADVLGLDLTPLTCEGNLRMERLLVLVRHGQSDWNLEEPVHRLARPRPDAEQGIDGGARPPAAALKARDLDLRPRLHLRC